MKTAVIIMNFAYLLALASAAKFDHYKIYEIDHHECQKIQKLKLRLRNTGIIIKFRKMVRKHVGNWPNDLRCTFEIDAPNNDFGVFGLFGVIQDLNLRQASDFGINYDYEKCLDYIQFRSKDGPPSKKFCGQFSADWKMASENLEPSEPVAYANSFIGRQGSLLVDIFVSKQAYESKEMVDMEIVITPYKSCTSPMNENYMACGANSAFCISKIFFNDSKVNCPFPDCVDEGGCGIIDIPMQQPNVSFGEKVLAGTISSLFILFAIFVLCLLGCKKHKVFCWAEEFARPTSRSINHADLPLNESQLEPIGGSVIPPTVNSDKDLPPSYDSLFPPPQTVTSEPT